MGYAAAIFDIDGVLVDSPHELAWREALQGLMQERWADLAATSQYTPERFTTEVYQAHVAGRPRLDGATAALRYFGIADPAGELATIYAAAKQTAIEDLIQRGAFRVFDDGMQLLLRLRAAGVQRAAASSSRNANAFLVRVPVGATETMLDLFDANVCGWPVPGKPDPAIFLAAAEELGLPPQRCVVVEDAPAGVRAARAAGMTCIGVARLDDAALLQTAGADLVVTNLADPRVDDLLIRDVI
ncbi:MAG: HAD family phosphatase [Oscillochloris sp.]|nr:HAD family phosphatase [Oscillochloris sp.]